MRGSMPEDFKILRLHSHGDVSVKTVAQLLSDADYAYNGVLAFDSIVRRIEPDRPWGGPWSWGYATPLGRRLGPLVLDREEVASLVHPRQRLRLDAVRLESPGFWDFLGKSVSVEAISNALNERKQRRELDRQEPHRRRIEELDEADRLTEAALNRYRALREMGLSEDDLAPFRNQLVEKPLRELARHVDSGLIESAEVLEPEERRELSSGEPSSDA